MLCNQHQHIKLLYQHMHPRVHSSIWPHLFSPLTDIPYCSTCTVSGVANCRFQRSFTGVDVLPGFADGSALLQIQNAANLAIIDSVISNIPGNLMIQNSTVQVLRSTFILNSGSVAGAMTIDSSQVALLGVISREYGLLLITLLPMDCKVE